jgi:hypothetical protein
MFGRTGEDLAVDTLLGVERLALPVLRSEDRRAPARHPAKGRPGRAGGGAHRSGPALKTAAHVPPGHAVYAAAKGRGRGATQAYRGRRCLKTPSVTSCCPELVVIREVVPSAERRRSANAPCNNTNYAAMTTLIRTKNRATPKGSRIAACALSCAHAYRSAIRNAAARF